MSQNDRNKTKKEITNGRETKRIGSMCVVSADTTRGSLTALVVEAAGLVTLSSAAR